jgi:glycosyltransferase involved in cell wall biosynthesis
MYLSVIIPILNGENFIGHLLDSLNEQTLNDKYEIIVVDNCSDDNTVKIAKSKGATVISKNRDLNISSLRNAGAKIAQGILFAFIDADCLPDSHWLEIGSAQLESHDEIGVVGGPYSCPVSATWVQRAWDSVRPIGTCKVNFVTSGNFFIKKHVFEEVDGFDENLETGEDYDLCMRVSKYYTVLSDEKIRVIHFGDPATLFDKMRKEIWYGKNIRHILSEKPGYLPFWASLFFAGCIFLFLLGIFVSTWQLLFIATFGIIITPTCITFIKCWKVKNYNYFFQLILINTFYLLGRLISIYFLFWPNKFIRRVS